MSYIYCINLIKYFSIPSFSTYGELLRIICKCVTGTINGIVTRKYMLCLHHYQTPLRAGTINWHLQQVRPSPRTRFITYLSCKQYPLRIQTHYFKSTVDYCKLMTLTNSLDILDIAMLIDENNTSTLLGSARALDQYC